MLVARFPDIAAMSVQDLGGTAGAWRLMPTRHARLVLLNMKPPCALLNVAPAATIQSWSRVTGQAFQSRVFWGADA